MSAPPRPQFFEGQLLAAGDLGAQVDYARFGDAVHARTQHTWGVVSGLTLSTSPQTAQDGTAYVTVSLVPGIAIDQSGRRIVVDTAQQLSTVDFNGLGVAGSNEPTALYPVYVLGVDQPQLSASGGACASGSGSATRIVETSQITFGRPGSEAVALAPIAIQLGDAPTAGSLVLVGYVAWNPAVAGGQFTAIAAASTTGTVRYAGVCAADVIAPHGAVALHTKDSGARFALALAEDGQGGCTLTFGKQQDDQTISPTFVVDEKGDVTFTGSWHGDTPTAPLVESGVISHGLCVPLPAGVSAADVTAGKYRVHVTVTPLLTAGSDSSTYPVPIRCSVDAARRVTSLVVWQPIGAGPVTNIVPAPCQYTVIAAPGS